MLIFLELVFTSHFYLKIGLNFLQKITYKRHRLFQFKKKIKRRKKTTRKLIKWDFCNLSFFGGKITLVIPLLWYLPLVCIKIQSNKSENIKTCKKTYYIMPSHFVIIRNIHHQNTSTYSHSIIYETKKENITHELFSKIKNKLMFY